MNKIYKVVWSKVKNCYVVVSELAKNVLTGGVKSSKIGSTPVVKGIALGSLMAFVITGNVWAETLQNQVNLINEKIEKISVVDGKTNIDGGLNVTGAITAGSINGLKMAASNGGIELGYAEEIEYGGVAIGAWTIAGIDSVAIGDFAEAKYEDSVAIGNNTEASRDAVAIGTGADTTRDGIAIGFSSRVSWTAGVAIGKHSYATENAVAIGAESVADFTNTVSFGHEIGDTYYQYDEERTYEDNYYRRLIKVADGINDHDVATVGQIKNTFGISRINVTNGENGDEDVYKTKVDEDLVVDGAVQVNGNLSASKGIFSGDVVSNSISLRETANNVAVLDKSKIDKGTSKGSAILGLAVGGTSLAYERGVAVGQDAEASPSAVSIGCDANAVGVSSIAIGNNAVSSFEGIGIGEGVSAGSYSVVIGKNAQTSGSDTKYNVAIGYESNASSWESIAIGYRSNATRSRAIAFGDDATADGYASIAVGSAGKASGDFSVALGCCANATGNRSVALGANSQAIEDMVVSVGAGESGVESIRYRRIVNVAEGNLSETSHDAVIGSQLFETNQIVDSKADKATTLAGYGITDAYTQAEVNAKIEEATSGMSSGANLSELQNKVQNISDETIANKTVITGDVEVSGDVKAKTFNGLNIEKHEECTITIGERVHNEQIGDGSIAIGDHTLVSGYYSTGIGNGAQGTGEGAVAVGSGSRVFGDYSTAVGGTSTVLSEDSVAIGFGATVSSANSIAIGAYSNADEENVVSVGAGFGDDEYQYRKIVNVAAGNISADSHDAVIGSQLFETNQIVLGKADKATTLEGYGITDAYTKEEIDGLISNNTSSPSVDAYTKAEVDEKLNSKVDTGTFVDSTGVAVGKNSNVDGQAVAVGVRSEADFGAVAIGHGASAYSSSIAIGHNTSAKEWLSIAIGDDVNAEGLMSIAIGNRASAKNDQSIAIGAFTDAISGSIAIGKFTSAKYGAVGIGVWSNAESSGVAIGHKSNAAGSFDSVAIGSESVANESLTVSFGHQIGDKYNFNGDEGIFEDERYRRLINVADGIDDHDVVTVGQLNTAVSTKANASDVYTKTEVDVMASGKAEKANTLAGYGITDAYTKEEVNDAIANLSTGSFVDAYSKEEVNNKLAGKIDTGTGSGLAVGIGSYASGGGSVAVGREVNAFNGAVAIGNQVDASNSVKGIAIGNDVTITGGSSYSIAIGSQSKADGQNSVVIGGVAETRADGSVALGMFSMAHGKNSIALGMGADAYGENSVAIGANSQASENTVSVGSTNNKRKVVNVAAGDVSSMSNDAVIGSQLYATNTNVSSNSAAIGTLTDSVAENYSYIEALQADISEHAGRFAVHTDAIASNSAAIGTLTESVRDNYSYIEALQADISEHDMYIYQNEKAIKTNAATVASNSAAIGTLTESVRDNYSYIEALQADVSEHDMYIYQNEKAIKTNATNIALKADKATTLEGYGIIDAYTQAEVNAKIADATSGLLTDVNLAGKADKADTLAGYGIVDAYTKSEIDGTIVGLESRVTDAYQKADSALENRIANTYKAADTALENKVTAAYQSADEALRSGYESADIALSGRINETQAIMATKANVADVYTKTVADEKFAVKASTLSGYGITDAYTQAEVNAKIADATSGLLTDANLTGKADKADTLSGYGITDAYTKAEVNAKIADATSGLLTDANLTGKADKADTLAGYGITDAYTKTEADAVMESKVDTKVGEVEFAYKQADKVINENINAMSKAYADADAALESKVTTAYKYADDALRSSYEAADSALSGRIDTTQASIALKANVADVYTKTVADEKFAVKASTLSGYGITDAYTQAEVNAKIADATSGLLTDANLTGKADKADTLSGYGITDAYTKAEVNAKIADATSGLLTDANLTGKADKADTLAGYGITDAYTKAEADAAMEIKVDTKVGEVESAYKQADKAINESINAVSKAYADADVVLENRVTNAYKVADTALESKVTAAYKSADEALRSSYETADTALSGRIDATQASIALKANIVDVYTKTVADAKFAVKASTLSGYGITDAYTQAEVNARIADATSGLLTDANLADKADRSYVDTGIGNVTSAYKSADTALSNRITANEESINALIEDINSIEVGSGTVSNKALETKLTNAYKEADTALETKITKGYQAVGNALSVRIAANETNLTTVNTKISSIDKEVSNKADKSTTLKGYGITDTYTKAEIDNKLNSATKSTVSDGNIIELKNKTQNISEETTEGNTVVNGDVEVLRNITAQYAEFIQGASFANDSVRISSDGIVRFGGSGKTSNVTIYGTGSTSIEAKGAVVAGNVVSNGQVESSGDIVSTNGDVKAGDVSLKETAQALEGKADKADTLSGYGITDAYTKAEVDSKFDDKVDAKDVYTKVDVDNQLADKVDKTYVDSNFAKVGDVYTKEEADATFVKRTELATIDENGNVVAISTKTELNRNFVVEDGVNGAEISINKGTDSQIIIGSDGSMLFGTNSTQIDDNGVFAGRIEMGENDPHNYANAQAAINQDGYIKGASGKFEVNGETGNVTGGTYNGIKLEQTSDGEAIINDVNINQMSEQVASNYDAITGLNQRLGQMNGKLNKVGAGAAALAALHPLEYDPDDKLTFSAGVGNYAGENAAALGAFYRPDEKLMFSLGGTMGNGENMVNLGVSIGLDGAKGSPKLSRKELIQIVGTMHEESKVMKAENEAIKAENEALEERIAKLEAIVAKLAEK